MELQIWGTIIEVELVGECIEVINRHYNRGGYPVATFSNQRFLLHRAIYMDKVLNVKKLDSSIQILHSCDNKRCINVNHLRTGTHQENMQDFGKLSKDDVILIRNLYNSGLKTIQELSVIFGVKDLAIWMIVRGKAWTNIK